MGQAIQSSRAIRIGSSEIYCDYTLRHVPGLAIKTATTAMSRRAELGQLIMAMKRALRAFIALRGLPEY